MANNMGMTMIDIEKDCLKCKHCGKYGLHAVKVECGYDSTKVAYPWTERYKTREYAKDCNKFEPFLYTDFLTKEENFYHNNNGRIEIVEPENINWI